MKLLTALIFFLFTVPAYSALPDIEAAVMNKDYAQARTLATKILKNSNNSSQRVEAQYYYGLAQLRLGQYVDARKAFQVVMDAHPDTDLYTRADLGMVESFYVSGFYKDALQEGEKILKKSPQSPYLSLIYLKIARANLKLMRWSKANECLNKIIIDFPDSLEASVARQLLEEREYFTVQVGSFLDKGRALTLINDLKSAGHYAYVVETTSPKNEKFYRVRVGQMTSLKDAKELEIKLTQLGYPTLIYP